MLSSSKINHTLQKKERKASKWKTETGAGEGLQSKNNHKGRIPGGRSWSRTREWLSTVFKIYLQPQETWIVGFIVGISRNMWNKNKHSTYHHNLFL